MKKGLFALLAAWAAWHFYSNPRPVKLGPGIRAPDNPVQTAAKKPGPVEFGDYRITPLADFNLQAKVLSRKRYRLGPEAKLAPVDLALGWGRMSDESVLTEINIRQSGRFYFWRTDNHPPIPIQEIKTHSANMHLIPSTPEIRKTILRTRQGEIIRLDGKLVRIDKGNWHWKSSLTRNDTGAGACEVIWVESFRTVDAAEFTLSD